MDDAVVVRFGQRPACLAQEHDDSFRWLRAKARHDLFEVEAMEQLHHVVEATGVVDTEVVELHGMRRSQGRCHLRLALEPSDELLVLGTGSHIGTDQLQGRRASQQLVPGQPHLTHAPGAQPRDEPVTSYRDSFVERLLVDLEHGASRHQHGTLDDRP